MLIDKNTAKGNSTLMSLSLRKLLLSKYSRRQNAVAIGLLLVLVVVIFSIPLYYAIHDIPYNDFRIHIELARAWLSDGTVTTPHFLFHFLLNVVKIFVQSDNIAAFVLAISFYIFLALVMFYYINSSLAKNSQGINIFLLDLLILVLMLVWPINFWSNDRLYLGYIAPNSFHNPTSIVLRPLALLLFIYQGKIWKKDVHTWFQILICAAIVICSTLAKPSYLICLLPCLFLVVIYRAVRQQFIDWRLLILGIGLPSILVLGWQFVFTYMYPSQEMGNSQIIFAPLLVMNYFSSSVFRDFILSISVPALIYICNFRLARKQLLLNISWLTFLIACIYTYFFAEGGVRLFHGNFMWSAQISIMIVYVQSAIFFLQHYRSNQRLMWTNIVVALSWLLAFISGLHYYILTYLLRSYGGT